MANNLVQAEANRYLDAGVGTATYTAPTTPMKLSLSTTTGTNTSAGTEVTGGSYARQTIAFGSASAGSASNSGAVTFTNMPAATITGAEIFDSAGTPRRVWAGALAASKTTSSGDSISFAVGAVVLSLV